MDIKKVTGRFITPPEKGQIFWRAYGSSRHQHQYMVMKVNSKSVRLARMDNQWILLVKINKWATINIFELVGENALEATNG